MVNKFQEKEFENIKIDINFSELEKLKKISKSLYLNKLVNPQKVKINLYFKAKNIKQHQTQR